MDESAHQTEDGEVSLFSPLILQLRELLELGLPPQELTARVTRIIEAVAEDIARHRRRRSSNRPASEPPAPAPPRRWTRPRGA